MPSWVWLNICFGALFILAVIGVPLWMVITRPDTGRRRAPTSPPLGSRTAVSRAPGRPEPGTGMAGRPVRTQPAEVS
jgi:hypothetical protein